MTNIYKPATHRSLRKLLLLCGILLLTATQTHAQNYRSAGNGNWNALSTWQFESPAGSGTWIAATSFPNTANDTVLIRNGHTVTINTPPTIRRLVVGEGTSGILQFDNATGRALTVGAGGVTIASGGQFNASGATQDGGNDTQTLTIQGGGSFTNNGTINFRRPDGYNNTGTAPNNQITNQSTTFTAAINPGTSTFTAGNYRHDNTGTYLVSNGSITAVAAMALLPCKAR